MKNRIFSFLLLVIVMVLFIPKVFAITLQRDPSDQHIMNTGTFTINGIANGDSFTAYKLVNVFYNQSSNEISYGFTSDFSSFLASSTEFQGLTIDDYKRLTSGDINSGSTQTSSTLDKLASEYATYVLGHSLITGTDMTTSGTVATASLEAGAYLILPKFTFNVYAVMVGNISLVDDNGELSIDNQTITAKVSEGNITKSVNGDDRSSATIGNFFNYTLSIAAPTFPTNATSEGKVKLYVDRLSGGQDFAGFDDISITLGDDDSLYLSDVALERTETSVEYNIYDNDNVVVGSFKYEISYNNCNPGEDGCKKNYSDLTIKIDYDKLSATSITVEYAAKLNSDAVIGGDGNTSNISEYIYSPYSGDYISANTVYTACSVYTYGIKIHSTDGAGSSVGGATFKVYGDSEYEDEVGEITIASNGYGTLNGVGEGIYYIKEVAAPGGYVFDSTPYPLEVTGDSEYAILQFENEATGLLPITGGKGTITFIVGGLLVIIGAIFYFVKSNKKKKALAN